MQSADYYRLLGISPDATINEIREAYLKKIKENHPDKFGIDEKSDAWQIANEYIKSLNEAYKTLSDPLKRESYNYESSNKRDTYANNRNQDRHQQKRNPYFDKFRNTKPITFDIRNAPTELKKKILDRQNRNYIQKVKLRRINYAYITIALLPLWFLFLYSVSNNQKWSTDAATFYFIISCIVGLFIFKLGKTIYKWQKSEIKADLILTPLYFIFTDLNKIDYTYLWNLKDIKFTNHYTNGIYQNTKMEIEFEGLFKTIYFQNINDAQKFNDRIRELVSKASEAEMRNDIKYFMQEDDLLGYENISNEYSEKENIKEKIGYAFSIALAALISFGFYRLNDSISTQPHKTPNIPIYTNEDNRIKDTQIRNQSDSKTSVGQSEDETKKITLIEKTLPKNGFTKYYSTEERLAPLAVETNSNQSFYIKLESYYTKKMILSVFIRPFQKVKIKVPLGSYRMKYAVGEKWYGEEFLFGPETIYKLAESRFDFDKTKTYEGIQYNGYTVELFSQLNGNLQTKEISPSEF